MGKRGIGGEVPRDFVRNWRQAAFKSLRKEWGSTGGRTPGKGAVKVLSRNHGGAPCTIWGVVRVVGHCAIMRPFRGLSSLGLPCLIPITLCERKNHRGFAWQTFFFRAVGHLWSPDVKSAQLSLFFGEKSWGAFMSLVAKIYLGVTKFGRGPGVLLVYASGGQAYPSAQRGRLGKPAGFRATGFVRARGGSRWPDARRRKRFAARVGV